MTKSKDCQSLMNSDCHIQPSLSEALSGLDDLLPSSPASYDLVAPAVKTALPAKFGPHLIASIKARVAKVKEESGYNAKAKKNAEISAHRKAEGRQAHNDFERGQYAAKIMREKGRPVNPYGVPDSPEKRERAHKNKIVRQRVKRTQQSPDEINAENLARAERRQRERAAMTDEQIRAKLDAAALVKKLQRHARKTKALEEERAAIDTHYATNTLFGKF